jgi:hypothetical protein
MKYYYQAFLFFAFCLVSANLLAQDTLKAKAGDWATELNANILQGELKLNNSVNQLKVRYFLNEKLAVRAAFDFSSDKTFDGAVTNYGTIPFKTNSTRNKTNIGINLGAERHLKGTRRLSPYIGGEISFADYITSQTVETLESTTTVDGAWGTLNDNSINYSWSFSRFQEKSYWSAGVNLIAGFDFYFSEKIYFGYEIIYNCSYLYYPVVVVKNTPSSGPPLEGNYPEINGDKLHFGPGLLNGIRLGFVF